MTPEEFQRLAQLFEEARRAPLEERAAFLDRSCADTPELRAKLVEMLSEHESPGEGVGFSSPHISRLAAALSPGGSPSHAGAWGSSQEIQPGDVIDGKYRILEMLGEGGLGVVYLAEQTQPVKRRVALKVVKLGMDTRQVLARFEAERNTLTLMDHAGIARIHDAGVTERGRPYFVMEHIQGLPITELADRERLDTRGRLELFRLVCAAVQHAHQKGIIHRDLKPSNILVSLQDGKPIPRIIDFGIAKATAHHLTERTLYTEQGQLIGTLEYMSPEQAEMSGLGVDSTTDIYSLGVILYELLTGVLPFDFKALRTRAIHEIQRLIRDEDPPRPSTRVSLLGDTTKLIVKQRRTEPRILRHELKGDLDWITMKAMEKQRTRRYASASELSADVQRHLDCQPVLAGPPSAIYKLGKFARRNRVLVVSTTLIILALLGGSLGATWGMVESRAQRDRAVKALEETEIARDAAKAAQEEAVGERRKAEAALDRAEVNVYYSRIAQAELSFRLHDVAKSHLSLEQCTPPQDRKDRRGWEWHYLRGLHSAAVPSPSPHRNVVYALAFSGDGALLASGGGVPGFLRYTGSEPGELKIMDVLRGGLAHDLGGSMLPVASLAFSPAVNRLAIATGNIKDGASSSLRLQDLSGDRPPLDIVLDDGTRWISSLAFDPAGRRLAAHTRSRVVAWDSSSLEKLFELPGQRVPRFSGDGERLITYGVDGSVSSWHAATGAPIRRVTGFPILTDGLGNRVSISPDERIAAVTGEDYRSVLLLDASSARILRSLHTHPDEVRGLAFSPDARFLATCGSDSTVCLWSLHQGEERYRFLGHSNRLECVTFSPGGERLASGGWDGGVKVWDLTRHPEYLNLSSPSERPVHRFEAIAFREDGRLVSVHTDAVLRTWDAGTGAPMSHRALSSPCGFAAPSRRWVFTPNGRRLYRVLADERQVGAWDVDGGVELPPMIGHTLPVFSLAVSPRGVRVASAAWTPPSAGGTLRSEIKVWNAADQAKIFSREAEREQIHGLALGPEQEWLLVTGARRGDTNADDQVFILLCDLASRTEHEVPTPQSTWIEAAAFSRDGMLWATADRRGLVVVGRIQASDPRNIASGERLVLQGPTSLADLAFSQDGRRLAVVNREVVTVWDTATGHEVITLRGKPRAGFDPMFNPRLAFSADGLRLAASQWDETLNIWSAEPRDGSASARPPTPDAIFLWHIREARDSLAEQNDAAARSHLRRLEGLEPPSHALRIDRGAIHAEARQWERGIADLSAAILADPRDSMLLALRGKAHVRRGDLAAAAADFARSVAMDDRKSPESWIAHTLLRLEMGDLEGYRGALPGLREAISDVSLEHRMLGRLALSAGPGLPSHPTQPLEDLEALWIEHPTLDLVRLALAAAALRAGDLEKAAKCLREPALPAESDSLQAALHRLILGMAEHRLGRAREAGKLLDRVRSWHEQGLSGGVRPGDDWRVHLIYRALHREAEALER